MIAPTVIVSPKGLPPKMNVSDQAMPWWLTPLNQVCSGIGVSGLSQREARRRRKIHGTNEFVARPKLPLVLEFLKRFRNPLVLVLLGASVVSALTGEVQSFVIISVMVLMSVTIDFVQEYRADRTAERLRQSVTVRATVLRDGTERQLPVARVVPGDLTCLVPVTWCRPTAASSRCATCLSIRRS
jgi:Mg2+-importing ATPase